MNGYIIFVKAGCMVSRQKVYRLASCDDLCLVHLKTIHTTFFGAPMINIDWMGSWITCREWFHGTWTYDAFRRWCLWKWKVPQKHPLKYVEFLFLIPQISIFLGSQIKIDHFPSIIDVIMRNLNYPMFTHPLNQPTNPALIFVSFSPRSSPLVVLARCWNESRTNPFRISSALARSPVVCMAPSASMTVRVWMPGRLGLTHTVSSIVRYRYTYIFCWMFMINVGKYTIHGYTWVVWVRIPTAKMKECPVKRDRFKRKGLSSHVSGASW